MAESIKDWKTTIIWAIGLIFICGMTYNTVIGMDKRVVVNTSDIKSNKESIHSNELLTTTFSTKLDSVKEDTERSDKKLDKIDERFENLENYLREYDFGPKKGVQ